MESALIKRLRAGDIKAFDSIYYMYARRLMSYCLRYVKVSEDAEEIVADVFISLWRRHEELLDTDSLKSLLYVAVRRRIINWFRTKMNSPIYADYIYARDYAVKHGADASMEYAEFERQVLEAIKKLPETQCKVVMMAKIYNMPNDKIAECLKLSRQTVKNALSVGIKTLRERLKIIDSGLVMSVTSIILTLFSLL